MAGEDPNIKITFLTDADTSGAEKTVDALKKVEDEQLTLQQQRDARIKGVRYDNPTFFDPEKEEAAARRAAAAASNAAAAQEAAANRAAMAAAEKAAAEQAAAAKIEAALAEETAAAEAQAIADEAIAAKKLANATLRALTPRNRQLSAAMSVANSPQAMAMLANPYVLATAAVVTLGTVASKVFEGVAKDMDEATAAGGKFEAENEKTAIAIHAIGSPWTTIKLGFSSMFESVQQGAKSATMSVIGLFDGGAAAAELASEKQLVAIAKTAQQDADAMYRRVQLHAETTEKILADELKLHAALDSLAAGREKRSGAAGDEVAANEVARQIQKSAQEDALIIQKINDAQADKDALLTKLHAAGAFRSDKEKEEIQKQIDSDSANLRKWAEDLSQKQKIDAINLTNKVEESQAAVKDALEKKLTDSAKELQKNLQAIVDSEGGKASPITQQALKQVNAILVDDKVTADQAGKLKAAAELFRSSADARSREQQAWIIDLLTTDKDAVAKATKLSGQIDASTKAVTTSVETMTAAATKSTADTQAALATHHAQTITSIQSLTPKKEETQAVVQAVNDVGEAFDANAKAIISALGSLAKKVASLQQQINQMASAR